MNHEITYPTSSSVGCTCGWSTEVPLAHSKPDAYLDQHFALAGSPGTTNGE